MMKAGLLHTLLKVFSAILMLKDGIIYVGTEQTRGIYKSVDDGYTWQWCGNDVIGLDIVALATHPSGAIFAASHGYGIFRSTDQGESWIRVHGNPHSWEAYITCLLIKPSGDIFAGCGFGKGLFRSMDQGKTWQELDMGFPYAPGTKTLALNASGDIYAATFSRGLLRSKDNGNSWPSIYYRDHMTTVFVAPNEAIYFGTGYGDGVYRSQDNGATWKLVLPTRVPAEIRAFGVNASDEVLVTYGDDGICLSKDGGDTWQRKNQGISATSVVALLNHPNRDLFAGSHRGGIFRSSNGMDWEQANHGIASDFITSMTMNRAGDIFAGTWRGGVIRTSDHGFSWHSAVTASTQIGSCQW